MSYQRTKYDELSDHDGSSCDSVEEVQRWAIARIRELSPRPDDVHSYDGRRYTRGGEDEKRYQDEREDSPLSELEGAHSAPTSVRRGRRSDRCDSPSYSPRPRETAGRDSPSRDSPRRRDSSRGDSPRPTYARRFRRASAASVDSYTNQQTERRRGESIDSVGTSPRPRRDSAGSSSRPRRLSRTEIRIQTEKAEHEAKKRRERERAEERKRFYRRNREKATRIGKRRNEKRETDLRKGDVVLFEGNVGIVRYIGDLHHQDRRVEDWIGVEFKGPHGNTDGSIRGREYFRCKENHGIFVEEVTKRLCPEDLLDQIAIQQHKYKEMEKEADHAQSEEQENERLKTKIAEMTHEICALKRNSVGEIASAVECKMEDFLNVLTDSLHPEEDYPRDRNKYGLPSRTSEREILTWLRRKKREQDLSSSKDPRFVNESVTKALVWVVRTLQEEIRDKQRYDSDSDGGSE